MGNLGLMFQRLQEWLGLGTLGTLTFLACALALVSTPIAFAIMGRQGWFQARRGRQVQRPAFGTVVVATMLVMGIPAILMAVIVKSQYFDADRYAFDPKRTLSVLDQGRQFEAGTLLQRAEKADEAVREEMARLAAERKRLHDAVKALDGKMLALGEAASASRSTADPMKQAVEALAAARAAVGIDMEPEWDELLVRLDEAPDAAIIAAGVGLPAGVATAPAGPAPSKYAAELAAVPAPQRDLAKLLPMDNPPNGFELGDLGEAHLETYNAENLYEKIDGRAESFTQFHVVGMAYCNYHPAGDDSGEVQLYIFEFASPLDAFGKFGSEKPPEAESVAIGDDGYASAGSVSFYRDKFFVQVVSTSDAPKFAEFSEAVARVVAARIGGEPEPGAPAESMAGTAEPSAVAAPAAKPKATPAAMFALLPAGPERSQAQYAAQDVFGYAFLSNVFLADYKEGDVFWQGFLRPYPDNAAAAKVFETYLETVKGDGAEVAEMEAEGAERMAVIKNIGLVDVVFLKGNAVAGANGATEAGPAESFARGFAKSLPDDVPTLGDEAEAGAAGGAAGEY